LTFNNVSSTLNSSLATTLNPTSKDEASKITPETPSIFTKDPKIQDNKDNQANARQDEAPVVPKSGASSITYNVAILVFAFIIAY
jgi:hypothetical protein